MPTAARRERDLRRHEDLILDAAEDLLSAHGYLGLNLDRLAERVEYSKGTLYNHFETKEDIVLSLASRHLAERVRLFERAAAFDGCPSERMVAVGIANDVLTEGGTAPFQVMQMSKTPSLWEKTAPARRQENARLERRCSEVLEEIVRAAVAAGDVGLTPAKGRELGFGFEVVVPGRLPGHLRAGLDGEHRRQGAPDGVARQPALAAGRRGLAPVVHRVGLRGDQGAHPRGGLPPARRRQAGPPPRARVRLSFFLPRGDFRSNANVPSPPMNFVALRMLTGDRAKYLGLIFSTAFATFLIAQQASIFTGLMLRTASVALASLVSLRKVLVLEPAIVFRG